jgi:hypothetical protein
MLAISVKLLSSFPGADQPPTPVGVPSLCRVVRSARLTGPASAATRTEGRPRSTSPAKPNGASGEDEKLVRLRNATAACLSGGRPRFELIYDHQFQRFYRLEILWRDLRLRDCEIEFGFYTEHQIDHIHRRQPDIHQSRFRTNVGSNRVLFEDRLDENQNPVLNVGVNPLHLQLSKYRRAN